jgi:hypothetical protein
MMKKMLIAAGAAVAGYFATKHVKRALEQKPLDVRVNDAKQMAQGLKNTTEVRVNDLIGRINALLKEQNEKK